jgi:hypothetical protein
VRPILLILLLLAACAGDEYSKVPEPSGAWVPANPPAFAGPPLQVNATLTRRGGL